MCLISQSSYQHKVYIQQAYSQPYRFDIINEMDTIIIAFLGIITYSVLVDITGALKSEKVIDRKTGWCPSTLTKESQYKISNSLCKIICISVLLTWRWRYFVCKNRQSYDMTSMLNISQTFVIISFFFSYFRILRCSWSAFLWGLKSIISMIKEIILYLPQYIHRLWIRRSFWKPYHHPW